MGNMKRIFVLNFVLGISFLSSISAHSSCKDVYFADPSSTSGRYEIFNKAGLPFDVYCDFHKGYLYTYISKTTHIDIDLNTLFNNNTHALVRVLDTSGHQKEVVMQQISQYAARYPISLQYNAANNYNEPSSHQILGPYLFLGFLPKPEASQRSTQGYKSNGHDHTFINCDANPNSYMAFYFNRDHHDVTDFYGNRCCNTPLIHYWVKDAHPVSGQSNLPADFFLPIEIHLGGCGGYGISGDQLLTEISGAALGIRTDFVDPCASAPCQHGGLCFIQTGNTFYCECTPGHSGVYCEQ